MSTYISFRSGMFLTPMYLMCWRLHLPPWEIMFRINLDPTASLLA